ncbi:hypothetical protein KOW79_002400 [Hemibagrus wyckioides]|uniref:Uncharacterized protein n=1 Tax=Hemibagrus wyckioides TaxID=337641 RepID=A0A9D3SWR5_9TELE|nr:hypothetical protein KOW79_002400 [Hemibagrus wyckioides]
MKRCCGEQKTARVSFSPGSQRASSPVMICATPFPHGSGELCGYRKAGSFGMRMKVKACRRQHRRPGTPGCNLSCRPPVTRRIAPFICG